MPSILFDPNQQFCDADGHPYAGGTINTYVVGTTTPKQTWQDHMGTAANPNPVVLDSAGRALLFGDGEYQLVLRDAAGNLVWNQYSTTIVSSAMQPVVTAPDLTTARHLLGVDDAISAAVAVEATARSNADNGITAGLNNEATTRSNADNLLTAGLNNEIARAEAAEAALAADIAGIPAPPGSVYTTHTGTSTTNGSGVFTATWPTFSKLYVGLQLAPSDPLFVGGYFQPTTITLNSYNGTLNTTDNLYPTPTVTLQAGKTFNWTVQGY